MRPIAPDVRGDQLLNRIFLPRRLEWNRTADPGQMYAKLLGFIAIETLQMPSVAYYALVRSDGELAGNACHSKLGWVLL